GGAGWLPSARWLTARGQNESCRRAGAVESEGGLELANASPVAGLVTEGTGPGRLGHGEGPVAEADQVRGAHRDLEVGADGGGPVVEPHATVCHYERERLALHVDPLNPVPLARGIP